MTKSVRLLLFVLAFFGGVAVGDLFFLPWIVTYSIFLCALIAYILARSFLFVRVGFVIAFGFTFGVARMGAVQSYEHGDNFITDFLGTPLVFSGAVAREPDVRDTHQKIILREVIVNGINVDGRILLLSDLRNEYTYKDELTFSCVLEKPEPFETFRYDKYLARLSVYAICAFPNDVTQERIDSFGGKLFNLKRRFIQNINQTLPDPHSALAAGILLGERRGLSEDMKEIFRNVGVTHILALSGFNISIIVIFLLVLGRGIGISRRYLFWAVSILIGTFVFITGSSPSVTRAAVMGVVILFAYNAGRVTKPQNILLLAGFGMVYINPLILLWDVGFQLSFMATLGLITFTPLLIRTMKFIPQKFFIRETISATVSAILYTLPLSLYYFHGFSLVAIPVNLLIVPLVPLAMFFSFFAGIFGQLGIFTFLWSFPSWFMLSLITTIAEAGDTLPLRFISVDRFSLTVSFLLYIFIFFIVRTIRKRTYDTS